MFYKKVENDKVILFGVTDSLSEGEIEISEQEYASLLKKEKVTMDYYRKEYADYQNKFKEFSELPQELQNMLNGTDEQTLINQIIEEVNLNE